MSGASFLLALACGAPNRVTENAFQAAREGMDLRAIAAAGRRAGLGSALGRWLAAVVPVDDECRRAVAAGLLAEAHARGCLALASDLAREAGGEALAIKGGALALAGLYDGERGIGDVDLLVPEREIQSWIAAAARVGASVERCTEAHELAYVKRGAALVELHAALPAAIGKDRGPSYDEVRVVAAGPVIAGIRPVLGRAAREISVHHFVFHHGGAPEHAMRALQDLSRLDDRGDGLPWGTHAPGAALAHLSAIGDAVRKGDLGGPAAEFVSHFAAIQVLQVSAETEFADEIDRWLALRREAGEGRLAFVLGRLFPRGLAARQRLERPFALAGRYLSGVARRSRPAARRFTNWRRFLEGRTHLSQVPSLARLDEPRKTPLRK